MFITLLIMLFFSSRLSIAEDNTGIRMHDRKVLENSTIPLVCQAPPTSGIHNRYSFEWNKVSSDHTAGDLDLSELTTLKQEFNNGAGEVLWFSHVKYKKDTAVYTCVIKSSDPSLPSTDVSALLTVLSASQIPQGFPKMLNTMTTKMAIANTQTEIPCGYHGDIGTHFEWFFNGEPIQPQHQSRYSINTTNNGMLTIYNVNTMDIGKYQCLVMNQHGSSISTGVRLTVKQASSKPTITEPTVLTINTNDDGDFTVTCKAIGNPIPAVEWLDSTSDYSIAGKTQGQQTLSRRPTKTSSFTCKATNYKGEFATKTIDVIVSPKPNPPVDISVSEIGSRSATMQWKSHNSQLNVTYAIYSLDSSKNLWRKIKNNINGGTTIVEELTPYTKYRLKLKAVSTDKESEFSVDVRFQTLEDIPGDSPQDIIIRVVSPQIINVHWSPPTQPNGIISEYLVYYTMYPNRNLQSWKRNRADSDDRSITISNLISMETYYVRIAASNGKGHGPFSEPTSIIVSSGLPPQVTHLSAEVINATHVKLSWFMPVYAVSLPGFTYVLNLTRSDGQLEIKELSRGTSYVMRNLIPNTLYTIALHAKTDNGKGPDSDPITVTTSEAAPSYAPVEIKVDHTKSTQLQISWRPPLIEFRNGKITNYTIYYMKYDEDLFNYHDIDISEQTEIKHLHVPGDWNSATIKTLDVYSWYLVAVSASTAVGEGPRCQTRRFRTGEAPPTGPPLDVEAYANNATSFYISWKAPEASRRNGEIKVYRIKYLSLTDNKLHENQIHSQPVNEYIVSNLKPATIYNISIKAINTEGDGPASRIIAVQTPDAVPSKAVLSGSYNVENNKVELQWEEPSETYDKLVTYKLRIANNISNIIKEDEYGEDSRGATIGNLKYGVMYSFYLCAVNDIGESLPSSYVITVPEQEPTSSPLNIKATALSDSTIFLQWSPPIVQHRMGIIIAYEVKYKAVGKTKWVIADSVHEHYLLDGLLENTNYEFKLRAATSAGSGPWSNEPLVTKTLNRPPQNAPQTLQSITKQQNSIVLKWKRPDVYTNEKGYAYVVYYTNNPGIPETDWNRILINRDAYDMTTTLDNLKPHRTYFIRVCSTNAQAQQYACTNTQHELAPIPILMTDVRIVDIFATKIKLHWNRPNLFRQSLQKYILSYAIDHGHETEDRVLKIVHGRGKTVDLQSNISEYTISSLQPGSLYTINMTVITVGGDNDDKIIFGPPYTLHVTTWIDINYATRQVQERPIINEIGSSSTIEVQLPLAHKDHISYLMLIVFPLETDANGNPIMVNKPPSAIGIEGIENMDKLRSHRSARWISKPSPYITAVFRGNEIEPKFVVGTGESINGFNNKKLQGGEFYTLFTLTVFAENPMYTFSQFSSPFKIRGLEAPDLEQSRDTLQPPTDTGGMSNIVLISVTCSVVIVIIAAALVTIYICYRMRMQQVTQAKPYMQVPTNNTIDNVHMRKLNYKTNTMAGHPPISIKDFAAHLEDFKANDGLKFNNEFESIDCNVNTQTFKSKQSLKEINKVKNRYNNILAYDHSRVVLSTIDGCSGSDYINANHVDGYSQRNAYISTQGPKPNTFGDFWRMIWEQKTKTIVMMTKLEEVVTVKCDQYWPSSLGYSETYGRIHVTLIDMLELATYVVRVFTIWSGRDEKREVRQFQFTAWPDHGVPMHATPVLSFAKRIKHCNEEGGNGGPIVVHCSAGVGRTGCFIAIDSMLERICHDDSVDIYGFVISLRSLRNFMIQTEEQYIFVHDAVLEAINSGNTEIPARSLYTSINELTTLLPKETSTLMEQQFKNLCTAKAMPKRFLCANKPANKFKNRLVNVLPYECSRVYLSPIRGCEGSDYINASFIDGYCKPKSYIATQGPLPETTDDFWRMLWEHNSTIVVMLTKLREMGREKCNQYWPTERSMRYQYFIVDPVQEQQKHDYILREFKVTDARDGQTRTIRQFHYTAWPEQGVPKDATSLLDLMDNVLKLRDQYNCLGPLTIHCSAGVGRTGVFITIAIVKERIAYESIIDIFQTIKMLRTQRPAMVQTEDQYAFCYKAVLEYLGESAHYDLLK